MFDKLAAVLSVFGEISFSDFTLLFPDATTRTYDVLARNRHLLVCQSGKIFGFQKPEGDPDLEFVILNHLDRVYIRGAKWSDTAHAKVLGGDLFSRALRERLLFHEEIWTIKQGDKALAVFPSPSIDRLWNAGFWVRDHVNSHGVLGEIVTSSNSAEDHLLDDVQKVV